MLLHWKGCSRGEELTRALMLVIHLLSKEHVLERFLLTNSNALLADLKPFDTLLAFSG